MTHHDDLDLTANLQTEGRRLARLSARGLPPTPSKQAQQQASQARQEESPHSLTEALRRLQAERKAGR